MGHEAWQMIGRTPGYIVAVRPLRGGAITDFEITQRMIRLLFQRAGVSRLYRARVLICVPSAITHVEQRAVLEAARRAGAAATYLIEQPMAAAIGAGLPIHEPMGNMVVDVGGGTTEVAVISLGGVVALEAVRVGSFDIDAAIQSYVRREYGIAIGERTSEEIKLAIGSAFPTPDEYKAEVRGRDLMSGLPKTIILSPEEVRGAIEEQVRAICDAVVAALAQTPPELAQDLILHGIHLVGGGGMLRGLDLRIAKETALPVHLVDAPLECVVLGAGRCLESFDRLKDLTSQVFGGLADLPVGVGEGALERGVDLGALERREGEDGAAADRGPVVARGQDRRQPAVVTDRAERRDR
jgi:rod shape-determining protein MreB